ncbi:MAG: hypothetical protein CMQ21_11425 [Gammaproteobacteria bacterium]|jgi:catechol 2,3-dioxygenase-like lactoylglutathione lyase family enzyme|nr:hypothetical protein [Gammaproteobacteria bacterium]
MADLTFGAHVTPVKDLDRATKFYTEALGLTVKTKEETGAILDAGDIQSRGAHGARSRNVIVSSLPEDLWP